MKKSSIVALLFIISFHLMAQRGPYKFYSKEDSIKFKHFSLVLSQGQSASVKDGKVVLTMEDSSYIDSKIPRDSAISELRKIPKFQFAQHAPSSGFINYRELQNSTRKDTITQLSFSEGELKKLPLFKILKCRNLKEIELIGSTFRKLPWLLNWSLFGLDSLKKITIYNYSNSKPFQFSKNTNITELIYRDSPYAPVPEKFYKLKNLEQIDLVRNDLHLSKNLNFQRLKKLKSVNLSNNSIVIKNLAQDTVESLAKLILSFNHLEAVPKEIGFFPALKELQLAENNIKSENIDPAIGSLKKLEMLSFYKNSLTEVPDYFFNSPHLIEFDIYYNNVEKIPEKLTNATQLERLFLANNKIFKIPETIGNLTQLKELYLHHNRISYLPESLKQLNQLTDFHIHNNYLKAFPSCVLWFKNLEDLDISFNEIHTIPQEITTLNDLKYLWVRGITFDAGSKEEAESIKQTLEQLQQQGVKVSFELEQEN